MKKENILKELPPVIYSIGYFEYMALQSHTELIKLIKEKKEPPEYCEYIWGKKDLEQYKLERPVTLYFDIDAKQKEEYDKCMSELKKGIDDLLHQYERKYILLTSFGKNINNEMKYSGHLIVRLKKDGENQFFENTCDVKAVYTYLMKKTMKDSNTTISPKAIDPSVYDKGGKLFRTIYSKKPKDTRERIFIPDYTTFDQKFEDIESFVTYVPENEPYDIIDLKEIGIDISKDCKEVVDHKRDHISKYQQEIIENIIRQHAPYAETVGTIHAPKKQHNEYYVSYKSQCPISRKYHKSNNSMMVLTSSKVVFGCHNIECKKQSKSKKMIDILSPDEIAVLELLPTPTFNQQHPLYETVKEMVVETMRENDKDICEHHISWDEGSFTAPVTPSIASKWIGLNPLAHRVNMTPPSYKLECQEDDIELLKFKSTKAYSTIQNIQMNITIENISIMNNPEKELKRLSPADIDVVTRELPLEIAIHLTKWLSNRSQQTLCNVYCYIAKDYIIYTGDTYYIYNGSTWEQDLNSMKIMDDIYDVMNGRLEIMLTKSIEKQMKEITKVIEDAMGKIGSCQYRKDMITLCRAQLHKPEVIELFDSNWDIIPFTNGVYDIVKNKFRKLEKEDYVTKTVGYDYNLFINSSELDRFLDDLFLDPNIRDYVLWVCSTFIDGSIPNDSLFFFVGSGGNGKTVFLNLLSLTFGELGTALSATLFSRGDSDPNIPRSDLFRLRKKRLGYISEPDTTSKVGFNPAVIKRLCGSEYIVCRTLYKEEVQFQLNTKFIIACNQIPTLPDDEAIWRRVKIIRFLTNFVVSPISANDRLLDHTIKKSMHADIKWRQSMMNKIIKCLCNEPKTIPLQFLYSYNLYKSSSAGLDVFLKSRIRLESEYVLSVSDILKEFFNNDLELIPPIRTKEYKCLKHQIDTFLEKLGCEKMIQFRYKEYRIHPDSSNEPVKKKTGWKGIKLIPFE